MSFEQFVAKRFMPRRGNDSGFSGPLSRIAVAAIALAILVMVMAVNILHGFQYHIAEKVSAFGSHIVVESYAGGQGYEGEFPIVADSLTWNTLAATEGVKHVQCYATKGGMVKTEDQIYGILLRGLSPGYDTSFYATCLKDGHLPVEDNQVLVSATIASRLKLHTGDKMRTYFWQGDNYRARAFTVSGIYSTDLSEVDDHCVLGTLHTVQRLNDWDDNQVGGYELLIHDMDRLDAVTASVRAAMPYHLGIHNVVEANPALFAWLDLLNSNITLILAIMCVVCAVAIVSAMLIMIFEKRSTIGLLKALGASSKSVRKIFIIKGIEVILKGILIGDFLALALSLVQLKWQPVRLDPESYSMSHVPVEIDPLVYAAVSIGVAVLCLAALLLPASYIAKTSPSLTTREQ